MWREFTYLGLEFKRLSAVPHFMWAIGGDRQVYVHVHGLDIPIRIKEETYENEVIYYFINRYKFIDDRNQQKLAED